MSSRNRTAARVWRLGQHLLVSPSMADRIVAASELRPQDSVVEIGTGEGVLTGRIAQHARTVRSFELDRNFYQKAKSALSGFQNVDLILGDAFRQGSVSAFDVCVTNLPYSESLKFIKWLATRPGRFRLSVAMLQKEFAEKITSAPGRDSYRAVSVLAQLSFEMETLFSVGPGEFVPQPRVRSMVLRFRPKRENRWPVIETTDITLLNSLFSFRGRRLSSALQKIEGNRELSSITKELVVKRVETMSPKEFSTVLAEIKGQKNE